MNTSEKLTEIDADTVQRLARQLAQWAQEFLAGGRSPFRRVETFAPLLTASGKVSPPLLFWINRDSFMAGGAVFFPDRRDSAPLLQGRLAAEALGLNYYVAWEADAIDLWQQRGEGWEKAASLPVGRDRRPGPADFHDALMRLMEEMKTFSVLGAIPPDSLSPWYLANLLSSTLASLLPPLTEHCRIHRALGDHHQPTLSAERQALGKAMLTLTRIMALALHDLLPGAVQPQALESTIDKTLAHLPAGLARVLAITPQEIPLPEGTLVRLHLLQHRLTQLGIARKSEGALKALEILLQHTAAELDGHPLPGTVPPGSDSVLLLHPDAIPDDCTPRTLVASPALNALHTLLRAAARRPSFASCAVDPMAIPTDPAPQWICGTLKDGRLPTVAERRSLNARLRLSWPTRRFRLPPRTPLWAWQLLHLLGLGAEGARFDLLTPQRWPTCIYGRQLLTQILETARLEQVRESDHGLHLVFSKEPHTDVPVLVYHARQTRRVTRSQLQQGHLSLLTLALGVPEEVWQMLADGRLTVPTVHSWPDKYEQGVFSFTRSGLGRYLWQVLGCGRPLPRRAALRAELLRQGLPLPGETALAGLQQLQPEINVDPPVTLLDQELTLWLGPLPELPMPVRNVAEDAADNLEQDLSEQELAASLEERVFMDGIPLFPEHYMYDYYRPEMRSYNVDGPLRACGEFFGTIEMQNDKGQVLQVEGQETAQALELIASLRTGRIELPADRDITAAILERYRADLRKLRSSLVKEVFRQLADPQSAKALVEMLWRRHALPPWHMITGN